MSKKKRSVKSNKNYVLMLILVIAVNTFFIHCFYFVTYHVVNLFVINLNQKIEKIHVDIYRYS